MPAVFGSATINNMPTIPLDDDPVQPPIGHNVLTAANTEMLNGHIGAALDQVVTPVAAAELIAADETPAIGSTTTGRAAWATDTGTWVAVIPAEAP